MRGKAVLFPALFVVALAAMSPSLATVEAQSSELEVYAGYYVPQPSILDSTATFGLRGGYNLNRRIGLYGDFQWVKLDPIDLRYFFLDFVADVNFFPDKPVNLTLFGGLGWAFSGMEAFGGKGLEGQLGVAVKFDLGQTVFLRVAARERWFEGRSTDNVDDEVLLAVGGRF